MSELKNCPFCESKAEHYSFNYRKHTVRCSYCLADCGEHDTPERAAFVWNSRPNEFVKDKEIERLKSALLNMKNRLFERTYLNFGEAMVADWIVRKVNEALATDTDVPANAPDTGKMEG